MGASGIGIGSVPISMLLLFFLTAVLGLRPALAGVVVALPKIWDVLVDPGIGGWVDRIARRTGTRTPILLASAAAYVVSVYLLFSLPVFGSDWATMSACVLLLIVSSVSHTALGVSHLAVVNDMTVDAKERTSLLAFSGVTTAILTLAATASVPILIAWGGAGQAGYARMAGMIALFSGVAFLAFIATTRRYNVRIGTNPGGDLSLFSSIRATFSNHAFYFLIGFLVVFGITAGVIGAFVPFINQYILHGGPAGLSVLGSIVLVCTIGAMPLAALIARRFGNLPTLHLGNLIVISSFPLMYAASFGPIWATWLVVGLFGLGAGGLAIILQSMIIDIAKTVLPGGIVVSLGVYLGILVAGQKLGQSAGAMLAGLVLDAIGFVSGAASQSADTISVLRVGYTLVPLGLSILGTVFLWRVKLRAGGQAGEAVPNGD